MRLWLQHVTRLASQFLAARYSATQHSYATARRTPIRKSSCRSAATASCACPSCVNAPAPTRPRAQMGSRPRWAAIYAAGCALAQLIASVQVPREPKRPRQPWSSATRRLPTSRVFCPEWDWPEAVVPTQVTARLERLEGLTASTPSMIKLGTQDQQIPATPRHKP